MRKQWVLVGILAGLLTAAPASAQHTAPKQQPATAAAPAAPTGELALGSVRLPKAMMADGKPLPAGTYTVRLTAQEAKPNAVGASENIERWVEFVQKGKVVDAKSSASCRRRKPRTSSRTPRRRPTATSSSRSRAANTSGSGSTRAAIST